MHVFLFNQISNTMETINLFTEIGLKKLFCSRHSAEIRQDFLSAFLPEEISPTLTECIAAHPYHGSTHFLFDFRCENSKGEFFLVELVFCHSCYSRLRSFYYARQMWRSRQPIFKKSFLIMLTLEETLSEDALMKYQFYTDESTQKHYFQPDVYVIHLKHIRTKHFGNISQRAVEWCWFIKDVVEGDNISFHNDSIFRKALQALDKTFLNKEELLCVEEQCTDQEEFQAALQTARSAEAFRIAQNLLNEGVSVEIVERCSGYSKEKQAYRYGMPSLHSNCFLMEENEVTKVEVLC